MIASMSLPPQPTVSCKPAEVRQWFGCGITLNSASCQQGTGAELLTSHITSHWRATDFIRAGSQPVTDRSVCVWLSAKAARRVTFPEAGTPVLDFGVLLPPQAPIFSGQSTPCHAEFSGTWHMHDGAATTADTCSFSWK